MSTPQKEIKIFNTVVKSLTLLESVDAIANSINKRQWMQHCVVNVAKIVNMQSDNSLRDSVNSCDFINVDGMGVVWGARLLGQSIPERVAGVDLFWELIKWADCVGQPIFLLGAKQEVLSKAVSELSQQFPRLNIAGYHHGYFWENEEEVVAKIRESGATMLFVAITSPKKEVFINKWRRDLGVVFAMGVGGTFDIVAGKTKRAPIWMQRFGLEWFYRVIQEPRRMWKRYLVTNTKFLWLVAKELVQKRIKTNS